MVFQYERTSKMKFTKLMCVCAMLLALFSVNAAQAGNGGYDTGYGYWGGNYALNYDTSAPTKGYAKNPDEVYNTQIKQAVTGIQGPAQYASMPQAYSVPQQQSTRNIVPVNSQQGYAQQQAYYQQPQHYGAPLYADPYHAQMEAKARELNLKQTDLALKNVDRQDRANDRAERRDKNYSIRDAFGTVNSGVSTVTGITNFIRSW